jgi:hypothetical protein
MPAEGALRRTAQVLVAALFTASIVVAGPAAPKAAAGPGSWLNPCNAPGGSYVCDKAEKGAKYLYDKSGADSVVNSVKGAADFATDPFGYIEDKIQGGTQQLFQAFGQELTGKNPESPSPTDAPQGSTP